MIFPTHARTSAFLAPVMAVAGELMTPNPVSLDQWATVQDAAAFLAGKGISAAPVIDDAGRPLGVVSSTDIIRYQRNRAKNLLPALEPDERTIPSLTSREDLKLLVRSLLAGQTPVREIMTPTVYRVGVDAPVQEVIETLVNRNIRRLYVIDDSGVLIGVVSATDILRRFGETEAMN